jgi:flagellar FliL protein
MAKAKKAEAEDELEEGAAEAAPKKKLPLKLIIIAVGGLVLLGGGGFAAMKVFSHPVEEKPKEVAVKPATFMEMPELLVNLSTTGSERTQYLKIKLVMELPDQTVSQQIQPLIPRVTDTFQTYLRELRPSDLDGSAGLYRLKEELTKRVNLAIAPNRVTAVLFKEIVVQ